MKNENDLIFAEHIRLSNVNPNNFALKNEYISNLMATCFSLIPTIVSVVGEDRVRVTRGFLSRQYMLDNLDVPEKAFDDVFKHSKGLALEITFEPYDPEISVALAKAIEDSDNQVKIIIDNKKQRISFYRENKSFEVFEKTNSGLRLIYSDLSNIKLY